MASANNRSYSKTSKLVIYIKDIELIIGKGNNAARRLLAKIKRKLGKDKDSLVSIPEFCRATGLSEEEVNKRLP